MKAPIGFEARISPIVTTLRPFSSAREGKKGAITDTVTVDTAFTRNNRANKMSIYLTK